MCTKSSSIRQWTGNSHEWALTRMNGKYSRHPSVKTLYSSEREILMSGPWPAWTVNTHRIKQKPLFSPKTRKTKDGNKINRTKIHLISACAKNKSSKSDFLFHWHFKIYYTGKTDVQWANGPWVHPQFFSSFISPALGPRKSTALILKRNLIASAPIVPLRLPRHCALCAIALSLTHHQYW